MLLQYNAQSYKDQIKEIMLSQVNNGLSGMASSLATQCSVSFPLNDLTTEILTNDLVPEITAYGFFHSLTDDGTSYTLIVSAIALS